VTSNPNLSLILHNVIGLAVIGAVAALAAVGTITGVAALGVIGAITTLLLGSNAVVMGASTSPTTTTVAVPATTSVAVPTAVQPIHVAS
jgi:hypothetical protein